MSQYCDIHGLDTQTHLGKYETPLHQFCAKSCPINNGLKGLPIMSHAQPLNQDHIVPPQLEKNTIEVVWC